MSKGAKSLPREKAPKDTGRLPLDIDESQVESLATIQCTAEEIGYVLGCSGDTIRERFSEAYKRGRESGKASLRRKQWKLADKNAIMAIFLGKNYLDQKDKQEITGKDGEEIKISVSFV